jgi:hypothetical protein
MIDMVALWRLRCDQLGATASVLWLVVTVSNLGSFSISF